jgi:hypothetical protein
VIWPEQEAKNFFVRDWTAKIALKLLEEIVFARTGFWRL